MRVMHGHVRHQCRLFRLVRTDIVVAAKAFMITRRTFLVTGALGAAALAAGGGVALLRHKGAARAEAMDGDARTVVEAIVPAMLGDALPADPNLRGAAVGETVDGVARAMAGLPPAARKELHQLFGLLAFAPTRLAFAGVASPWQSAPAADVEAFLARWRDSRWSLKKSAYDALHQLIYAAWYANPRSWPAIGYPGPPKLFA